MLSGGPFFFAIACDNLYLYLFICLFFSVNISSKCYVYSLIKTQFKKKRNHKVVLKHQAVLAISCSVTSNQLPKRFIYTLYYHFIQLLYH